MKNLLVLSIIYLIGISLLLIFNELTYRRLGPKGEVKHYLINCVNEEYRGYPRYSFCFKFKVLHSYGKRRFIK